MTCEGLGLDPVEITGPAGLADVKLVEAVGPPERHLHVELVREEEGQARVDVHLLRFRGSEF